MPRLPEGMVTFLFTDIEGSTRLVQQLGERYAEVLAQYRRLIRASFRERSGQEVDTPGDAFFVAFVRPKNGLLAAVQAQRAIGAHPWPEGISLSVRMGLHTGEALISEAGYVGLEVHRAARIAGAAWGGQIVLSQTTRDLIADSLPEDLALHDLGLHGLKDLTRPQRLFQVVTAGLRTDFPPLRSLQGWPNNLPIQLTSFVGRQDEKMELKELLPQTRLLTITGAGGAGKTRLALQVAAELLEEYPDGVWWVELASLTDPPLVPQTVASTLRLREEPGRPLLVTLSDYLRDKHLLLILDNCEHLVLACARLSDSLLRACPNLRILATSRESLGAAAEQTWRVPSLSLPDPVQHPSLERLKQYEAVQLFAERARGVVPTFAITEQNGEAVAQVCRQLDGIPLAVELAAVRVRVLSPQQIGDRLGDSFRLLTQGTRTAPPRHQTLRAAMDWSYELLPQKEQTFLCRLSVFAGGFTFEAAERVAADDGVENTEIPDLLTHLVDKSLVTTVAMGKEGDDLRFRLLETVRQYAWEKLIEAGETQEVAKRHRGYFLTLAEEARPHLYERDQLSWLNRLEDQHGNLRSALEFSLSAGEAEAGLRLVAALGRFWEMHGHLGEGRRWAAAFLSMPQTSTEQRTRSMALNEAGTLAFRQGDFAAARAHYEESLTIRRSLEDKAAVAKALGNLGIVAGAQGDYVLARSLFEESLEINRMLNQRADIAVNLNNLGMVARNLRNYPSARSLFEESLSIRQELGDRRGTAMALDNIGVVAMLEGDYPAARSLHERSLEIERELGNKPGITRALCNLAAASAYLGDSKLSRTLFTEGLRVAQELSEKVQIIVALEGIASLEAERRPELAARLFGAADALREAIGAATAPASRRDMEGRIAKVRAALAEDAFTTAWAEGQSMRLEQTIECALEETPGL